MILPVKAADILLPKKDFEKWACVACDQFTSQPEYWQECDKIAGDSPSALRLILPEAYLDSNTDTRIDNINTTMTEYLNEDIFTEHKDCMIYVERRLKNGAVRHGLIAAVDLEAYDYNKGAISLIRATEGTVLERIPPRVKIRREAPLELPHIMLLINDEAKNVIEPISDSCGMLKKIYDFDLMMGGGHISGYLLGKDEQEHILKALSLLAKGDNPLLFAVGDGNHSLAAAKACYEQNGRRPCERFALCEIVNIHDDALVFEPIYRVMFGVDEHEVISAVKSYFRHSNTSTAQRIEYITHGCTGVIMAEPVSALPVGTLQAFIDEYTKNHPGVTVDYIHGEDVTRRLSSGEGCIGFLFSGMEKTQLFGTVIKDGALPRKTFSMGEACEKRYYLEARRIK